MPSEDQIRRALQLLEAHAAHPATRAVHDPLYALLDDPADPERVAHLVDALRRPHPVREALLEALALELPRRSLEAVLAEHAPFEGDPVEEVARRLAEHAAERQTLLARVSAMDAQAERMTRLANGLAMIGAVLFIFAALGWLAAMELVPVPWLDAPEQEAEP